MAATTGWNGSLCLASVARWLRDEEPPHPIMQALYAAPGLLDWCVARAVRGVDVGLARVLGVLVAPSAGRVTWTYGRLVLWRGERDVHLDGART